MEKRSTDIFHKVHSKRTISIFQMAFAQQIIFWGKIASYPALAFIPIKFFNNRGKFNFRENNIILNMLLDKEILFNFKNIDDIYCIKGRIINFEKKIIDVQFEEPLYRIQRRENFRLSLPESYKAQLTNVKNGNSNPLLNFKIINMSAGGLKIFIAQENFVLEPIDNDLLDIEIVNHVKKDLGINFGTIKMEEEDDINIYFSVVYSKQDVTGTFLGIKIQNPNLTEELFSLVLKLYRKFYLIQKY